MIFLFFCQTIIKKIFVYFFLALKLEQINNYSMAAQRSNSLIEKDLSLFTTRPKGLSSTSRSNSLQENDITLFKGSSFSCEKPQKLKRRATISVLIVETEKDEKNNKVVMSRSGSFKIDYCPDSPNFNLENTHDAQYLTPFDHGLVTPQNSSSVDLTPTKKTNNNMNDEELFPKFLPLPTCTIPFQNKTYMVFAYHEDRFHSTIPRSISLATNASLLQNRRKTIKDFDDDCRDDGNHNDTNNNILQCFERIPSELCLPMFDDE